MYQPHVNGNQVDFLCEPRQSLLECLRDVVGMTGTKEGCNDGNCGACTVVLDDRIVTCCLVLGVEAQGREITTVEGVASAEGLHPGAAGLPGERRFAVRHLHARVHCRRPRRFWKPSRTPTKARIRHWLAGNLCRCTGYDKIVRAVLDAGERMKV